jgi:Right handed beta helix region
LYVAPAPTGNDANTGTTEAAPLASMAKAQQLAKAGDTVLFRGGTYAYTQGTTGCGNGANSGTATISGVVLDKDGSAGSPINYFAYPGEVPVFDFDGIRDSCRIKGMLVSGDYLHLRGLEIKGVRQNNDLNHESWGVWNQGSHNTFEALNVHHIMGAGIFIQHGSDNLVLNCDSHHNFDEHTSNGPGESADGFGCHVGAGETGNVIRGCRAWWDADDGYDFINADAACTVEYSWAWFNGYKPDTMDGIGNGNGFKGGGYGADPAQFPAAPAQHSVRFCLAFANKAAGFYANHHPISELFYNNTSYANHPDFNMLGMNAAGADITVGVYRNNIALGGTLFSNRNTADDANNSWSIAGLMVSEADFESVATTGMDAPRQADGSLPVVTNFHLAAGSDLIDAGTDLKFPFAGKAPDLGAFEVGAAPPGGFAGAGGSAGAATGGSAATNGGAASGGNANGGGGFVGNDGGAVATAGAVTVTGGAVATGGAANVGTGAGSGPMSPAPAGTSGDVSTQSENAGCGCRFTTGFTTGEGRGWGALFWLPFAGAWWLRRRRAMSGSA